jgi:hypothetical protein
MKSMKQFVAFRRPCEFLLAGMEALLKVGLRETLGGRARAHRDRPINQ